MGWQKKCWYRKEGLGLGPGLRRVACEKDRQASPCLQRTLSCGWPPSLGWQPGRQGQGYGQEATPAPHLLLPLPMATSPSTSGQAGG